MGRWILVVLVAANIGYFGWTQFNPPERNTVRQPVRQPGNSGPVPLLLVGETQAALDTNEPNKAEPASVPLFTSTNNETRTTRGITAGQPTLSNCIEIGPLQDPQLVAAVREALTAAMSKPQVLERASTDAQRYWVYIPPYPSRGDALARLRELRDIGVDSFMIESIEELRNGISLGIFSDEDAAGNQAAAFSEKGITAQVFRQVREEPNYYLAGLLSADQQSFRELLNSQSDSRLNKLQWYPVDCAEIAVNEVID